MSSAESTAGAPRADILRARNVRHGWLLVAAGALIPVLALWGMWIAIAQRRADDDRGQEVLIAAALAVFVLRVGLWVTGTWP